MLDTHTDTQTHVCRIEQQQKNDQFSTNYEPDCTKNPFPACGAIMHSWKPDTFLV